MSIPIKIGTFEAQTVKLFHERILQDNNGHQFLTKIKSWFNAFTARKSGSEERSINNPQDRRKIADSMVKLFSEQVKENNLKNNRESVITLNDFQTTFAHALMSCDKLGGKSPHNVKQTIELVMRSIQEELRKDESLSRAMRGQDVAVETPSIDNVDIETAQKIYRIEQNLLEEQLKVQSINIMPRSEPEVEVRDRSVSVWDLIVVEDGDTQADISDKLFQIDPRLLSPENYEEYLELIA